MRNNDPLLPRVCEPTADFLLGDKEVPSTSYRCRRQRELTRGEVEMAYELYRHSINYSIVRIVQESYLPFNLQGRRVAMAPKGLIYMPAYGDLYSMDYSSASRSKKHVFIHEMCHVFQYQAGMSVFIRGMVSGVISYNYEINFNSQTQSQLAMFRMEQQASIMADYWYLLNYGVAFPWEEITRLKNFQGRSAADLIPFYESILGKFLSMRSTSRLSSQILSR